LCERMHVCFYLNAVLCWCRHNAVDCGWTSWLGTSTSLRLCILHTMSPSYAIQQQRVKLSVVFGRERKCSSS